jgi:3-oxoacyl-[acyl-carrier protein] reductase
VIITVASAAGRIPGARAPIPYGAAKAAIALLTQDVAAQAGPYGIRANCIAPETILTERNRQLIPAAQQANWAGFHPLKRLGTPPTSRPPRCSWPPTPPRGSPAWSSISSADPS